MDNRIPPAPLTGYQEALLRDLVVLAERHALDPAAAPAPAAGTHQRRLPARRVLVGATAAAALAATLTIAVPLVGGESSAYAVQTLPNGTIDVRLSSDFADPKGLERRLREAGLDVEVRTVAREGCAGRLVGTFASAAAGAQDEAFIPTDDGFTINPAALSGGIVLWVGEEGKDGPVILETSGVLIGSC